MHALLDEDLSVNQGAFSKTTSKWSSDKRLQFQEQQQKNFSAFRTVQIK